MQEIDETIEGMESKTVELPCGLHRYRVKLLVTAAVFGTAGVALAIYFKAIAPAILLLFAAFFVLRANSIVSGYACGTVAEHRVICTSVNVSNLRRTAAVSFVAAEGEKTPYRCTNITKRDAGDFCVNGEYIICIDKDDPHTLLYHSPV